MLPARKEVIPQWRVMYVQWVYSQRSHFGCNIITGFSNSLPHALEWKFEHLIWIKEHTSKTAVRNICSPINLPFFSPSCVTGAESSLLSALLPTSSSAGRGSCCLVQITHKTPKSPPSLSGRKLLAFIHHVERWSHQKSTMVWRMRGHSWFLMSCVILSGKGCFFRGERIPGKHQGLSSCSRRWGNISYNYWPFHTKSISMWSVVVITLFLSGVSGRTLHRIKKHFSVEKNTHVQKYIQNFPKVRKH